MRLQKSQILLSYKGDFIKIYFSKFVLKSRLRKLVKLIEIVCNIFYLLSPLLRKEIVGFCAVFPKINSSPMIKFDFTNLLFFSVKSTLKVHKAHHLYCSIEMWIIWIISQKIFFSFRNNYS